MRDAVVRVGRDVALGAIVAGLVFALVGWRLFKRRRAAIAASTALPGLVPRAGEPSESRQGSPSR
ncbi:MAG: hypothetical protein ACYC0B_06765 [Gemmatimonadaceae bacterium]